MIAGESPGCDSRIVARFITQLIKMETSPAVKIARRSRPRASVVAGRTPTTLVSAARGVFGSAQRDVGGHPGRVRECCESHGITYRDGEFGGC